MTLAELSPVDSSLLPFAELKDQLRLPAGFPDDGSFDDRLAQSLRTGLAVAEARTGKALFIRQFRWTFESWGDGDRLLMPMAPLVSLDAITLMHADGTSSALNVDDFTTITDIHKPALLPRGSRFPTLAQGSVVDATFTAGFGASWASVPADLREAVLIMAADCFDGANGAGTEPSSAVMTLLQRYRGLSLGRIGG